MMYTEKPNSRSSLGLIGEGLGTVAEKGTALLHIVQMIGSDALHLVQNKELPEQSPVMKKYS